jgi:hypothetical protein
MATVSAWAGPDLDAWVPRPGVRTRRCRTVACSPEHLWDVARGVRLRDTRALGRLVAWRIPETRLSITFDALFRAYPFVVLDEGERHLVAGLCGRIWTLARDYPRLAGPEEFAAWKEPDTVRVAFAHWVAPRADGGADLCTEARVEPTDRAAALRLKALWAVVGRFEPLVASEPFSLAARRAAGR